MRWKNPGKYCASVGRFFPCKISSLIYFSALRKVVLANRQKGTCVGFVKLVELFDEKDDPEAATPSSVFSIGSARWSHPGKLSFNDLQWFWADRPIQKMAPRSGHKKDNLWHKPC